MVLLLVECTQTFGINDYDRQLMILIFITVEYSLPDPESFGARVDRRANSEASQGILLALLGALLLFVHTRQEEFVE